MPFAQDKITALSIKPLAKEDKFGNKFRFNFQLDGDNDKWFTSNNLRGDDIPAYVNKDAKIGKGLEIEFMYTVSGSEGQFKNIQATTLKITGGELQQQAPAQPAPAAQGYQPKPDGDYVNPSVIGQILNLMVDTKAVKSLEDITPQKAEEFVIKYNKAKEIIEASFKAIQNQAREKTAEDNIEQMEKQVEVDDNYGDDSVPF